ncbi:MULTISPECIES: MaoC family dehydratase [Halocynthiibacter]|uniref:MaoC family dehydratase n=1 Tax=Halocynthiibacter halioticoli TaxID=2986804 RepID=A0AAE3J047_9RHOB|nr:MULTISPECIES: MaoC family dehydratase [Halocynthiibacter]MCV6823696.1 MaoC family dehydratase [Halocynthiibacter halioticoli]MCW4056697.1 MaoC family dehydratase [Halocynthiibacter sp. SDUM655004]
MTQISSIEPLAPHRDNLPRGTICIEDLEVGMSRYLQKEITDRDIALFAEVSTDHNPVHLDDDYAHDTIFEGRIAHGMLTAGLVSAVIGEQLPGHGTIYLGQSLKFLAPVRPGDVVRAEVTVADINYTNRRVALDCICTIKDKPVLKGEAQVLATSRKFD